MKKNRKYLAVDCSVKLKKLKKWCIKKEVKYFRKRFGTKDIVLILDATKEDGEWLEEIWDVEEAGFNKPSFKPHVKKFKEYQICYKMMVWVGDGRRHVVAYVVQDASPIGIYMKKEDLEGFKIKYHD